MIKRLTKTKKSKQGAILVIVVLILALAMIFIASAMMLTQATRTRLYENTVQSQARLTVTAASEVFIEALQTQEITDDQIDSLVLVSSDGPHKKNSDKIKMVVDGVPGMSKAEDNCTYLDVYAYKGKTDTVFCDFTTIIGTETENVSIELHAKKQDPTTYEIFNNQIDIGADVDQYNLRFVQGVGMYPSTVNPTNNNIIIRGSTFETASGSVYFSNLVFVSSGNKDAFAYFGGGNVFNGDFIFKDDSYMSTYSSTEAMNGDFFFFGDGNDKYNGGIRMKAAGGWESISSSSKFVFVDRNVQGNDLSGAENDNWKIKNMITSKTVYFIGNNNSTVTAKSPTLGNYQVTNAGAAISDTTLSGKYNSYKTINPGAFPSSVGEVFKKVNPDERGADKGIKTIAVGQKTKRIEYAKLPDGTYKTYSIGYEVKGSALQVYKWPLTETFPTKDYFYDGSGNLMEEEFKKYYDVSGNTATLKSKCQIILSNKSNTGNTLTKIDNNTTIGLDNDSTSGVIDLEPGWYQFQPGTVDGETPFIIALNGASAADYRLYFKKGTYDLYSLIFAVYGGTEASSINIILEPGAVLNLCDEHNRNNNNLCMAGFISVDRSKSTASAIANYIWKTTRSGSWLKKQIENGVEPTGTALGECQKWSDKHKTAKGWEKQKQFQIYYSKYYDGVKKPRIFIYGGKGTQIWANSCATIEAYVGLYGSGSTFGGTEGKLDGKWPTYIYGRIQCSVLSCGHSQECYCMPYCPQPGGTNTKPKKRAAETKYDIVNIKYYYGITSQ